MNIIFNFIPSIFLVATGIMTSFAQQKRVIDQEVVCLSPVGTVSYGQTLPLKFKIINHGPDSRLDGDTLFYSLYLDDGGRYNGKYNRNIYSGALFLSGGGVDSGQSVEYADNYGIKLGFGDIKSPITVDFCVQLFTEARLTDGTTIQLSYIDPKSVNNVHCTQLKFNPPPTGIHGIGPMDRFSIYPNPAIHEVFVDVANAAIGGEVNLTIIDLNGSIRFQRKYIKTDDTPIKVDTRELSEGFYFISIHTKTGVSNERLLIKK